MKAKSYIKIYAGVILIALGLVMLEPFVIGLFPGVSIHYTVILYLVMILGAVAALAGIWITIAAIRRLRNPG